MDLETICGLFQQLEESEEQSSPLVKLQPSTIKWQPISQSGQKAFTDLLRDENREALRAWYQQFDTINRKAEMVRQALQLAAGEELSLKPGKRKP